MSDFTTQPKTRERGDGEAIPSLSIILVCWNNKTYMDPCLQSLYEIRNAAFI